jgi:glycosyltransferase involved in cell wall biosynthesis
MHGVLALFPRVVGWAGIFSRRASKPDRKPQLLVDVSVIYRYDARTGIQRVVRAVWLNLRKAVPPGYELVPVAATRTRSYRVVPPDFFDGSERTPLERLPEVARRIRGDIFFALDFSAHILPRRASELLRWRRSGCRIVVMIYDLLPHSHPEWFSAKLSRHFRRWLEFVVRYADDAICISVSVAANMGARIAETGVKRHLPLVINSVRLGADIGASGPSTGLTDAESEILKRIDSGYTLLAVGTIEPRKGHAELLDAFELASKRSADLSLIIVGKRGWKTEQLQDRMNRLAQVNAHFFWFSEASDEMLTVLYERCSGVVVASLDEGFGLPIVEALAHGCPVLARDIPVFRELATTGVSYFESECPHQLAEQMLRFAGEARRAMSLAPPSQTTWEDCVAEIVDVLGLNNASPVAVARAI